MHAVYNANWISPGMIHKSILMAYLLHNAAVMHCLTRDSDSRILAQMVDSISCASNEAPIFSAPESDRLALLH
jgi:hypothetical protein